MPLLPHVKRSWLRWLRPLIRKTPGGSVWACPSERRPWGRRPSGRRPWGVPGRAGGRGRASLTLQPRLRREWQRSELWATALLSWLPENISRAKEASWMKAEINIDQKEGCLPTTLRAWTDFSGKHVYLKVFSQMDERNKSNKFREDSVWWPRYKYCVSALDWYNEDTDQVQPRCTQSLWTANFSFTHQDVRYHRIFKTWALHAN